MKIYVTFGQMHVHRVNGKILDKDCVAVIEGDEYILHEFFGNKFSRFYCDEDWNENNMIYYPRGYIYV